jgi:hypothetical protein
LYFLQRKRAPGIHMTNSVVKVKMVSIDHMVRLNLVVYCDVLKKIK